MIPKINEFPRFELVIPSTGKTVKFRPYLVKEEKVLLTAWEDDDIKASWDAIIDTLSACSPELDTKSLTLYDVQYIFNKVRAHSVGETANITVLCKECQNPNNITVNIEDVDMPSGFDIKKKIKIGEGITVELSHPKYLDTVRNPDLLKDTSVNGIITLLAGSLDYLYTNDEKINFKEHSQEEILEFVNSLTQDQFKMLWDFLNDAPKLEFKTEYECSSCKKENVIELRDSLDFF